MAKLSISTWSLHPLLQPVRVAGSAELTLLDVPRALAERGFDAVEICHFHFPTTEGPYLESLTRNLKEAGIEFFSLLIDTGDISQADQDGRERDLALTESWIEVAARCGAKCVRVAAGEAPPSDQAALERAIAGFKRLTAFAAARNVRVLTENWKSLASTPANCKRLIAELNGELGLLADFGNFPAASKYEDLAEILPLAEDTHAKADETGGGTIDEADYDRCLELCERAGFSGPYTIVYAADERWRGIEAAKARILRRTA
ncbi:MAG TPA: TIM barrel protein [Limnochordia bacterium]|nr:TIM barrel protein [Limnochordia bacterium]